MQSKAETVAQYLAELPEDRRAAIEAVRKVVLKNLDKGYEEGMQYGMIGYYVPHRIYPAGYHCDPRQPLPFAALASQKNYMSLYLGCVYDDGPRYARFQKAWAKTGKKLDMGKSCIRFKRVDDLALDVIAEAIRTAPAARFIEYYETVIKDSRKRPAAKKKAGGRSTGKKKTATAKARPAAKKEPAKKTAAKRKPKRP